MVAARREERLDDLVERINGDGDRALTVAADLIDERQDHDLVQRAKDEFGHAYPEFAGFVVRVDNETKRDRSVSVKGW